MCGSCDLTTRIDAPAATGPARPATVSATDGVTTVFRGGAVYTMNPAMPWVTAVAVRGDSIIAVGSDDAAIAAAGADARIVELDGRMLLPGFVEGHIHPLLGGLFTSGVDLQVPTKADALAAIAGYAQAHPNGPVRGFGWRMDMFGPEGPRREELDAIVPDRPVLLFAIDAHSVWVNSATLELAGITTDTPDPAPGFSYYARDPNGEPTGFVLEVAAFLPIADAVEPITADLFGRMVADWLPAAAAAGITAVFDAGMPPAGGDPGALAEVYTDLEAQGRLPFRVVLSHLVKGPPIDAAVARTLAMRDRFSTELVRGGVLKIVGDGTVEGYTGYLLAPYSDKPDSVGQSALSDDDWRRVVAVADAADIDIHIHAIGDATARVALDAIEAAIEANPARDRRHTIAHLQLVDEADLPRFAELGVIAQFSPNWIAVDPSIETIRARLGDERLSRHYLLRTILEYGATISFGTDWPAAGWFSTYKPLDAVESAVTRRTLGEPDAPVMAPADQRLDLAQALQANTLAAARQLRLDDLVGSLELGKRADLVVLRDNLFGVPSHRIASTPVEMTMMNGRFTYGDPFAEAPPNG